VLDGVGTLAQQLDDADADRAVAEKSTLKVSAKRSS